MTNLKKVQPREGAQQIHIPMHYGAGLMQRHHGGSSFIACMIELLKNSLDWRHPKLEPQINIATADRMFTRIGDNGIGMVGENKSSFSSVNMSTASKKSQAGLYCTGSKKMLYSFASSVDVTTVTLDEPTAVTAFSLVTDEYERRLLKEEQLTGFKSEKTSRNWPYSYETGTQLLYKLRNPESRAVIRGEALAAALSARLPTKIHPWITVDGKPLPTKQILGELFIEMYPNRQLGDVTVEFYQPKKKLREEGLYLCAGEIGEVSFMNFLERIGTLAQEIPEVYSFQNICGTISAPFLKPYIHEDRKSFVAGLADDRSCILLARMLRQIAPLVEKRLAINIQTISGGVEQQEIADLLQLLNKRYNPDGHLPPGNDDGDGGIAPNNPSSSDDSGADHEGKIRLDHAREYEIGQQITVRLIGPKDFDSSQHEIRWDTSGALATKIKTEGDKLTGVVTEEGNGLIVAEIVGTPFSPKAHYNVVAKRVLKLSASQSVRNVGEILPIMARNTDKLKGVLKWKLEGVGKIEPTGDLCKYYATQYGTARLVAWDSKDASASASVEISVRKPPKEYYRIRDCFFEVTHLVAESLRTNHVPVSMTGHKSGNCHRLFFNTQSPAYRDAQQRGGLQQFLRIAISEEYARFKTLMLDEDHMEMEALEFQVLFDQIRELSYSVYAELNETDSQLGKKK